MIVKIDDVCKNDFLCVLNFSGGKDSIYLLHFLISNCYKLDLVIFADTGLERPETYSAVEKAKLYCARNGVKFVTVKSGKSFYELSKTLGVPNKSFRWCNSALKIKPMKAYLAYHFPRARILNYIGICADEPDRINRAYNRVSDIFYCYPLFDKGITEDVCRNFVVLEKYYSQEYVNCFKHSNCFCCPFMWDSELQLLDREQLAFMCEVNDFTKFKYRWSIDYFLNNFKKTLDKY